MPRVLLEHVAARHEDALVAPDDLEPLHGLPVEARHGHGAAPATAPREVEPEAHGAERARARRDAGPGVTLHAAHARAVIVVDEEHGREDMALRRVSRNYHLMLL